MTARVKNIFLNLRLQKFWPTFVQLIFSVYFFRLIGPRGVATLAYLVLLLVFPQMYYITHLSSSRTVYLLYLQRPNWTNIIDTCQSL